MTYERKCARKRCNATGCTRGIPRRGVSKMYPISSQDVDTTTMFLLVDHPYKLPQILGPFEFSHQRDMTAVSIRTTEENDLIESDLFKLDMKDTGKMVIIPFPCKFFDFLHCDKAQFSVDESEKFVGYTDGATWNGWAMPYFTREVAEQVIAHLGAPAPTSPEKADSTGYEDYVFKESESSIIIDPVTRQPIQVWAIGSGRWCWEEHPLEGD